MFPVFCCHRRQEMIKSVHARKRIQKELQEDEKRNCAASGTLPDDGNSENAAFRSVNREAQSVGDFIRVYLIRNDRWASPKYLAGESYGTVRNAGLGRETVNGKY